MAALAAVAAAAAGAIGCVAVTPFADAPREGNAELQVRFNSMPTHFSIYENGLDCSGTILFLPPERMNAMQSNDAPPLVIRANRDFAFFYDGRLTSPLRYCSMYVSFFPEPNARYRAWLMREADGCSVRIMRLGGAPGAEREEREPSFRRRTENMPFGPSGPKCKPL